MVFTPNDVGDLHSDIIHYVDEVKARIAAGSLNHEIAFFAARHFSANQIVDDNRFGPNFLILRWPKHLPTPKWSKPSHFDGSA